MKRKQTSPWQHRGISPLSITGKILARILLNCQTQSMVASDKALELLTYLHKAVGKEVSITESQPLHHLHEPDQGLWHHQPWWAVENHVQVWLPWQAHFLGQAVPWQHTSRVQDERESSWPLPVNSGVKQSCLMAPPYSEWCSHPCWQIPSVMVISDSTLGTSLTGSSWTSGDYKQKPKCKMTSSITSCLHMTVNLMVVPL